MPKTFDTPTRKLALSINESDLENTGTMVWRGVEWKKVLHDFEKARHLFFFLFFFFLERAPTPQQSKSLLCHPSSGGIRFSKR